MNNLLFDAEKSNKNDMYSFENFGQYIIEELKNDKGDEIRDYFLNKFEDLVNDDVESIEQIQSIRRLAEIIVKIKMAEYINANQQ